MRWYRGFKRGVTKSWCLAWGSERLSLSRKNVLLYYNERRTKTQQRTTVRPPPLGATKSGCCTNHQHAQAPQAGKLCAAKGGARLTLTTAKMLKKIAVRWDVQLCQHKNYLLFSQPEHFWKGQDIIQLSLKWRIFRRNLWYLAHDRGHFLCLCR